MLKPENVRVTYVIAGLDPAHGGPSYAVPRLCAALGEAGAKVALLSVALRNAGATETAVDRYNDRRFPWDYAGVPMLGQLRYSSGLARALRQAACDAQVIHNHGLWPEGCLEGMPSKRLVATLRNTIIATPARQHAPS
jgi:hypothetical protein